MVKVGIVGGTGYSGAELLRLLAQHAQVRVVQLTSRKEAGTCVGDYFPQLQGQYKGLRFRQPDPSALADCDLVLFATPHATAMHMAPALLERDVRVIDLSADFRLRDAELFRRWYGHEHACPQLLAQSVYGLPELYREQIRLARIVGNPGCYPTAVQLGFLPLLRAGIVDTNSLIADCKSGVSGAGRELKLGSLYAEAADSFKAYGAGGHRHLPEIEQGLAEARRGPVSLTFTPHLAPMIRGIHATLYARLQAGADLQALFEDQYRNEPFVDVLAPGGHPDTRSVRGSNLCRIAVHRPQGRDIVVVLSVIDNLVKGAAGQAVQNLNLMFGLDEHMGLDAPPLWP